MQQAGAGAKLPHIKPVKVVWTPDAEQDRIDVWDCVAADNPHEAARMDELFSNAAARLANFPKPGRPGKIAGTRELIPHESDRPVYEIAEETTGVLALISTSRPWPLVRC